MHSEAYQIGVSDFLRHKENDILARFGDDVMLWASVPTIDREWLKGYMDALIEYMQQNNLENI